MFVTLIINSLVVFLFWVAGFISISPAYNHFVQYAHVIGKFSLPILTEAIFSVRLLSLIVPFSWLLGTLIFLPWLMNKEPARRSELVQLHTSLSLLVGLLLLVVLFTAGILPYLKIGTVIS